MIEKVGLYKYIVSGQFASMGSLRECLVLVSGLWLSGDLRAHTGGRWDFL